MGLANILQKYLEAGYECREFHLNEGAALGSLYLRHDVDLDLNSALEVATLEQELGMSATFFFLVTSNLYNVMSAHSRETLLAIEAMGHRIGLHFDPTVHPDSNFLSALREEKQVLEFAVDAQVRSFSLHRPGTNPIGVPDTVDDMVNTYARVFTQDITYSSDSGGWWRFGRHADSDDFAARRSVQLLMHPIWWTSRPDEPPGNRLDRLREQFAAQALNDLQECVTPYRSFVESDKGAGGWLETTQILRP